MLAFLNKIKSLDLEFKLTYLNQIVSIGVGFSFMALLSYFGTLGLFGVWVALNAIHSVFTKVFGFPTNEAQYKFFQLDDGYIKESSVLIGFVLDLLTIVIMYLLLIVFQDFIQVQMFDNEVSSYTILLFAAYSGSIVIRLNMHTFIHNVRSYNFLVYSNIFEQLSKLFFCGLLVYFDALTIDRVMLAVLLSSVLANLVFLFIYLKFLLLTLSKIWGKLSIKRTLQQYFHFIKYSYFSLLVTSLSKDMDKLLISYLFTNEVTGIYGAIKQFTNPISFITTPIITLFYKRFSIQMAAGKSEELRAVIKKSNILLLKFSVPVLFVFSVAFYSYVTVIHIENKYFLMFGLFLIGAYISTFLWWIRPFTAAVDPKLALKSYIFYFCVYTSLFLLLVNALGILGIAVAFITAQSLLLFYWRYKLKSVYETMF